MKGRDRIVLMVVAVAAALVVGWMIVVSPERQKASKLGSEVATAQSELSTAEGQLASARAAQSQYSSAYASVVRIGKAVPPDDEVPSLIYQLSQATHEHDVGFDSIVSGSGSGSSSSSSSSSAAAASATPTAFAAMPFTFVFEGGFFDLERLFRQLTAFTTKGPKGTLLVSGRLLTIQGVKLAPQTNGGAGSSGKANELSGTITATAYVLPGGQTTAGPATSAPAGASATPASSTSSSSSPTPPAIARVTP
jgi:hypothetical protein